MKYGVCPTCGDYGRIAEPDDQPPEVGFVTLHRCKPRWLCTFGEEGEHDPRPIYASTAAAAAIAYAKWFDGRWFDDAFSEDCPVATVIVTDDRERSSEKGRVHKFNVSSEVVREYHAAPISTTVHDKQLTAHGTVIDMSIEFGPEKDGKIFPELAAFEHNASPEEIEKLRKEQDGR